MQTALDFVIRINCWLMALLYIGLFGSILVPLLGLGRELVWFVTHFPTDASAGIVSVLRLISLVLIGQLASIVSLAGIRSLRPSALRAGAVNDLRANQTDLGNVRVRIISVMVAIGAVDLLGVLLGVRMGVTAEDIFWKIMILVTFAFVGVSLVVTERIANGEKANSA